MKNVLFRPDEHQSSTECQGKTELHVAPAAASRLFLRRLRERDADICTRNILEIQDGRSLCRVLVVRLRFAREGFLRVEPATDDLVTRSGKLVRVLNEFV